MKTFTRSNGTTLTALPTLGGVGGNLILQRKLRGGKIEGTMVLSPEEVAWLTQALADINAEKK